MRDDLKAVADQLRTLCEGLKESRDAQQQERLHEKMRALAPKSLNDMMDVYYFIDDNYGYPSGLSGAWDGLNGWMH